MVRLKSGESRENALKREISEELTVDIDVRRLIKTIDYDYPNFHLTMHCYQYYFKDNEQPKLLEHENAKWVSSSGIKNLKWLPADLDIVDDIIMILK